MSKYALRTATALALVAALSIIAVSLLTTGAADVTASNADASAAPALIPIPAQYTEQCSNGVAVPNPASNAGLVSDCAALLAAKSTLADARAALNWSANVAISSWSDVDVRNGRVTLLRVRHDRYVNGKIPAELGNLTNLTGLLLDNNQLTGGIPAELGNLDNLRDLFLNNNQLTGAIPAELGSLARLGHLDLGENRLTGAIPAELGNLAMLTDLYLDSNQLTGAIPAELGNIPRLDSLRLNNNRLTGCIPQSLRSALGNREIGRIGLPICGASTATPTSTATSAPTATPTSIPTPAIVIEPTPTPTATSAPRATATPTATSAPATPVPTPTPTATSAPRATPTPTSTPAATSTSSGEVMNKLDALGRQVAENPDLSRQVAEISDLVAAMSDLIATMAARIAEIEGGDTGAATATPTTTPAIVIEPTPTTTPSPTPTRVAGVDPTPASSCVQPFSGFSGPGGFSGGMNGSWAAGCLSANPPNDDDYYARFYTFTIDAASEVTVTLSSDDAAPFLYLLNGAGTGGSVRLSKGAAGSNFITITTNLQPGAYTIEATTYYSQMTGDFTIQLEIER